MTPPVAPPIVVDGGEQEESCMMMIGDSAIVSFLIVHETKNTNKGKEQKRCPEDHRGRYLDFWFFRHQGNCQNVTGVTDVDRISEVFGLS